MIKPFPVVELETEAALSGRFRQWAAQFGTFRLGRSLGVAPRSVQRWTSGERIPDAVTARQIIALSTIEPLDGNPLTYEDIYGTAQVSHVEVRTVERVQAWE